MVAEQAATLCAPRHIGLWSLNGPTYRLLAQTAADSRLPANPADNLSRKTSRLGTLQIKEHLINTLIDVAVADGHFKTLAKALTVAGLVDTLKGAGPFTVFAPTDDSFAKLPAGTFDALLKDIPKLTAILKYHVLARKVAAADVVKLDGKTATPLNGANLKVSTRGGVKLRHQSPADSLSYRPIPGVLKNAIDHA